MTPPEINIVRAEQNGDYRIRLDFDDGSSQTVDFLPFLSRATHPDIRVFLQPELFRAFRLEYGELVWGDYELCFPTIDLYRNSLDAEFSMAEAA
ncbi:MAG: DUF2442 domain-containing protein [Pseudomonadota bacterium]|nr:DUF2442 domain-containing protein [Pseudomonadota bacterium]MDP1905199.1 DUF2442 domain-containing protein [Pseudomonadota bacterium]MDP2351093.1 DUF2442 domain-containing protein [Pseudomonadota bacterium]